MQLTPIASNMTEVETSEARILFSYRTPVAAYIFGEGYVKTEKYCQLLHQGTSTSGERKMVKKSHRHVWIRWYERTIRRSL